MKFQGDEEGSFDSINSSHISINELVSSSFFVTFLKVEFFFFHSFLVNDS